jgi:hypothetical protein
MIVFIMFFINIYVTQWKEYAAKYNVDITILT